VLQYLAVHHSTLPPINPGQSYVVSSAGLHSELLVFGVFLFLLSSAKEFRHVNSAFFGSDPVGPELKG